jgi:RNA polymerase sigma-70 factor (ECF subfamily)
LSKALPSPPPPDFIEVYHQNFDFVYRTLRRLGVRQADVADATQDVFVIVHRRLPDFEGRSAVTTWLFRICYRAAKDRRRRAAVRYEVPIDQHDHKTLGGQCDGVEHVEQRESLKLLSRALDSMKLPERAVFTLFELEGLTCSEIAETLELPLGTVYSRLHRSRKIFKRSITVTSGPQVTLLAGLGEATS